MPVTNPLVSARNLTPTSTELTSPPSPRADTFGCAEAEKMLHGQVDVWPDVETGVLVGGALVAVGGTPVGVRVGVGVLVAGGRVGVGVEIGCLVGGAVLPHS